MTRDQELQPGKEAASQVEREMEVVRSMSAARWTSPWRACATLIKPLVSSPKDPPRSAGWKKPAIHARQGSRRHHRDDSAGDWRVDRGAGQLGRALFLYEPGQGTGLIMSIVSAILPLVVYRFFSWSTADCFRSAADFK